ncbi:unnamed protein product, partial [Didymodactylos carnosus]
MVIGTMVRISVNEPNINVPGQFIFRTTGNITNIDCNSSDGLLTTPYGGSTLAGYTLQFHGICFNETSSYRIKIENLTIMSDFVADYTRQANDNNQLNITPVQPILLQSSVNLSLIDDDTYYLNNFTLLKSNTSIYIFAISSEQSKSSQQTRGFFSTFGCITSGFFLLSPLINSIGCALWSLMPANPVRTQPCPCIVPSTFESEYGGFKQDDACKLGLAWGCNFFHPGAHGCYRGEAEQAIGGARSQCCYTQDGKW